MESETRKQQLERHQAEVERDQQQLRESITSTERLLSQSDALMRRSREDTSGATGLGGVHR